jgi:hypothetical protein
MSEHIYFLSCYYKNSAIFMVRLTTSENDVSLILKRGLYPINGVPLERKEFYRLRENVIDGVEIGWFDQFEYYLEEVANNVM